MREARIPKTGQNSTSTADPGNKYRIEIVNSFSTWESMSASWNALLRSSRANTVFLTWEWLFCWAESFLQNRRLFILAVYQDQELVAIAPWYLNRISGNFMRLNQIEFLGSPEAGSDYLDVIIKRGKEREATHFLYHFLFHEGRTIWDCLLLRDIPSDSLFLLHFQDKIESEGKYAELSKGSYCPLVTLPKSRDWIPGVSPKRKARFKQDLGRLEKNGELNHRVHSGDAAAAGVDEFFSFYNQKTGHDGLPLRGFLKKISSRRRDQNLLQVNFLTLQGRTIAALLHLRYQDELLLYLMAVDKGFNPKISSGNVLVGLCLQQAREEGMLRYDFLKGNESYKFYWADSGRTSLSICIIQKKLSPLLFTTARFVKYTAKMMMR
jgi:CelD/BcsL family acetyltransferase involved in cellulose biosynthesis